MPDITVTELELFGYPIIITDLGVTVSEDADSQDENGIYSETITGDDLQSQHHAKALGDYIVYRYEAYKARPSLTLVNQFTTQIARDIGDRVSVNFGLLNVSAKEMFIRSLETTVTQKGAEWTTTFELEQAPTAATLFSIGGSADEGIGGTGILAY